MLITLALGLMVTFDHRIWSDKVEKEKGFQIFLTLRNAESC